jgi:UDP-glucuronate 4-epimerase
MLIVLEISIMTDPNSAQLLPLPAQDLPAFDLPGSDLPITDKPVVITGAAGFIGASISNLLLKAGLQVVGLDNLNDYYDPRIKQARLRLLRNHGAFRFVQLDLADWQGVQNLFESVKPQYVVHLAAQAGVRYAMTNPKAYADSNLLGSTAILQACRDQAVKHLVFASSSSVYGSNQNVPFSEQDAVNHPVSFYAASKRSNELMAHSYSHLFNLPITMLRYFTVYGPWGRPDMAIWKFTDAILNRRPIDVYAGGLLSRDFTYINDIAHGTIALLARPSTRLATSDPKMWNPNPPDQSWAPFEVFNIGRSDPIQVNELISLLEGIIGFPAHRNELPMQAGDVERTFANCAKLTRHTGYLPKVDLAQGLDAFVRWFKFYHHGA